MISLPLGITVPERNPVYPPTTDSQRLNTWLCGFTFKPLRRSDLKLVWLLSSGGRLNFSPWDPRPTCRTRPGGQLQLLLVDKKYVAAREGQTQISISSPVMAM